MRSVVGRGCEDLPRIEVEKLDYVIVANYTSFVAVQPFLVVLFFSFVVVFQLQNPIPV